MIKVEKPNINFSGRHIARNTAYNLLGYGIPLIFAIAIIPFLIKGLGTEKFGLLNLAFVVIGYFSFFDFGIGRALTKIVAEKLGSNQEHEIPSIFWTSIFLMLFISIIGALILLSILPSFVFNFIKISKALQSETLKAFNVLVISIPIVTTTAGIRGVLEAYQKFSTINIIRTFLGTSMFLVPWLCLFFTDSLFWIIIFLIIIRIAVWILYLLQCFKLNSNIKRKTSFEIKLIKPILKLSGWMTVSNIIVPILVYLDRFLIGALVSATAIAYYSTPYEAVTKLLLVPGALIAVLFPAFSASHISNPDYTKKLSFRAAKYIFIFLFPIIFFVITFANELMSIWLGNKFAENSTFVLQLLSLGVLFNGIAYIPFTYLQGIGRPDITAKVNLIELPFYLIGMWLAVKYMGIDGAALVWMIRMVADGLILFLFSKILSTQFELKFKPAYIYLFILIAVSIFTVLSNLIYLKIILTFSIIVFFLFISWRYLLLQEERIFLTSYLRVFKFKGNA